ncbi:LuxR C-terminal-related transcriptional regulator, partial [Klebsiella pneumoniae]|nr:LuxR C-terminal-related transcriptional regulator [Klebsiella pneumoniae]MDZ0641830.1 LuxR C-terminal-related transcriptional regulator [Klebsiella pneumoniae]MDZ0658492.1 LuxR C-terminal-related transcriptional regulator [Klebsiella pneumoniae]
VFAGKKSAQIREILISESAWEEMTCLFAPSIDVTQRLQKYLQNASDHRCIKVFRKSISSLDSCVNIKLTKQEDSLLPYIISGLNNKKIAQATDLSNMMISHYRRNIYQKLNVRNIAGLYHFLHSLEGG